MLTRIALWLTLGITLDALGVGWLGTALVLALAVAIDLQGRADGEQHGAMVGIASFLRMNEHEQTEIKRMVKQWEQK